MNALEKTLRRWTGQDTCWWMRWVEEKIASHTGGPLSEDHPSRGQGFMKPEENWIKDLAQEVRDRINFAGCSDGNIAQSRVVSLILVLWTCRVMRSKTYKKGAYERSVRKRGYKAITAYDQALLDCMMDESKDHVYFPDQEWESPFVPQKKRGTKR